MKAREKIKRTLSIFYLLAIMPVMILAQDIPTENESSIARTVNDPGLQWGPCPEFMPGGCEIAILHGNPAEKNVDILFKVPANSDIPNHAHTSAERMILISGEMDITYEGEEPQTLISGAYAYGPAGKPHIARCGDAGPCILFIAFEEPLDAFAVQKK